MAISVLFTGVAIAAVLVVVGYRVFRSEGTRARPDVAVKLPAGVKVLGTAIGGDHLALTVEIAPGQTEVHLFDLATLQPRGRLKLTAEP